MIEHFNHPKKTMKVLKIKTKLANVSIDGILFHITTVPHHFLYFYGFPLSSELPMSFGYKRSIIENIYHDRRESFVLGETADKELASLLRSMSLNQWCVPIPVLP